MKNSCRNNCRKYLFKRPSPYLFCFLFMPAFYGNAGTHARTGLQPRQFLFPLLVVRGMIQGDCPHVNNYNSLSQERR
jgi:hypothetical protein